MRINEILTELLDTVSQWKVDVTHEGLMREYNWEIGDLYYRLIAANMRIDQNLWLISFSLFDGRKGINGKCNVTGTGNELQVFSTVIDIIMNDVIPEADPSIVLFDAELCNTDGEPTGRADLYKRLVNRYLPANYTATNKNTGNAVEFVIRKEEQEIQ